MYTTSSKVDAGSPSGGRISYRIPGQDVDSIW